MANQKNKDFNVLMTTKRIETLADGIFAIAMTLLVLSIEVPQIPYPATNTMILESLGNMIPQFFSYLLSFILLAIFWRVNHQQFNWIKKSNSTLLWINIIWLMFVALVPFSTNFVGDYGYLQVPMVFFNLNIFAIGIMYVLNWNYAVKNNFVDNNLDPARIAFIKRINWVLPLVALFATVLAFISPEFSSFTYLIIFFMKKIL